MLYKMKLTVETVAIVETKDMSSDKSSVHPYFAADVLRETIENVPHEDIKVELEEIKNEKDLPKGWSIRCLPFMGDNGTTIRTILENQKKG